MSWTAVQVRAAVASAFRVRPELIALLVLAFGFVAVPWLRGEVVGRQGVAEYYARLSFVAHQVRLGELPLWNPYILSGTPQAADVTTALFYPLTIPLILTFSLRDAINTWVALHLAIAGLSMYLYLGTIPLSRPARFLGAVIYMLPGFASASIFAGFTQRLALYALIPLTLYFVGEIIRGRRRTRAVILGGATVACQFLAGDPQTFVYATSLLTVYAAGRLMHVAGEGHTVDQRGGAQGSPLPAAFALAMMLCFAAGLTAIQALPTLRSLWLSNRAGFDRNFALIGSIPPLGLVSLIAPHFFGDEVHAQWGEGELRAPDFYVHSSILYVGFFVLALVIIAIYGRRDRWHVRFFGLTGLLVLWLALGKFGYLYRAVVYLPFLRSFRDIEYINTLVPLCASVLAGIGFDRYREAGRSPGLWKKTAATLIFAAGAAAVLLVGTVLYVWRVRRIILILYPHIARLALESALFVLIMLCISVGLLWLRSRSAAIPAWQTAAAIVFVVADLIYAGTPFVTAGSDLRNWEHGDAAVHYLRQDPSLYRVLGLADRGPLFRIQDVEGESALLPARYSEYTNFLQGYALDTYLRPGSIHGVLIDRGFDSPLLNLLNVKYIIVHRSAAAQARGLSGLIEAAPGTSAYINPKVVPRVLGVVRYTVLRDRLAILRELSRPGYDPRKQIILEESPDVPAGAVPPDRSGGPQAALRVLSYEANFVVIRARFARPGFLVLNDLYDPAWMATVDGRPARVYRANYLFRAVVAPAGDHTVRFFYRDRFLEIGEAVSGLTVIAGLLAWAADRRRRKGNSRLERKY